MAGQDATPEEIDPGVEAIHLLNAANAQAAADPTPENDSLAALVAEHARKFNES
jgi:hypothetical protein